MLRYSEITEIIVYTYLTFFFKLYRSQAFGSIWRASDLLRLLGPDKKPKDVTMSTLVVHGTLLGWSGRLCQTASYMSKLPSRASAPLQWNTRLPHKLHSGEVSRTSCWTRRYSMPYRLTYQCWYIEPRNREKSLTLIWQHFSCLLDEWIAKISKKKFFHDGFLR